MTDKFVDSILLDDEWEIETDTGWKPLSEIHKTIPFKIYKLILEDNLFIECADDHIVFDEYMQEIFVKDIHINQLIQTKFGLKRCIELIKYDIEENMYDVTVNDNNHRFYSNDILSHNTDTTWAYILWYILFNDDKRCAIIAHKEERAKQTLARLKKAYELLPDWLQQGVLVWNKKSIDLENGSSVLAAPTTESGITGDTISLLYLDEFALVNKNISEAFWASSWPTISSGTDTKVIISSTPRGYNLFWKFWVEAESGESIFKHFLIKWNDIPWRNEEWLAEQRKILASESKFNSEILCKFEGSTNTLITNELLNLQILNKELAIINKNLKIFKEPEKDKSYITVIDVARGVGNDYSVVITIDVSVFPYEIVAVYRNDLISPYSFPEVIFDMAVRYNESYILVENNDSGCEVADILYHEYSYSNMFFSENKAKVHEVVKFSGKIPGLRTTSKVKLLGCSVLKTLLENQQLIINDREIFSELSTFIKQGRSYAAEDGYYDDLVMCLVLFSWLTQQTIFKNLTNVDTRKLIFNNQINIINDTSIGFGFDDGINNTVFSSANQEEVDVFANDSWLFR